VTAKCVAVAPVTTIAPETPVIDVLAVSVAVSVLLPAVFNVAESVAIPFVSVVSLGITAALSLEVKCTVPVYPALVFW